MDHAKTKSYIDRIWDSSIVPELTEYIRIPNKSVAFDPEWLAHGHMDKVVARFEKWAREHAPKGATIEVVRLPKRTPLLFMEIPGHTDDCILLYGHMDKQPEMAGWREGLDAWTPKLEGDKLYGRGAADDGYAMFACLSSIARWRSRASRMRDASWSSRHARKAAASIFPRTSSILRRGSDSRAWSSRSTPDAATTSSYGARPRCAAWSAGRSPSRSD